MGWHAMKMDGPKISNRLYQRTRIFRRATLPRQGKDETTERATVLAQKAPWQVEVILVMWWPMQFEAHG